MPKLIFWAWIWLGSTWPKISSCQLPSLAKNSVCFYCYCLLIKQDCMSSFSLATNKSSWVTRLHLIFPSLFSSAVILGRPFYPWWVPCQTMGSWWEKDKQACIHWKELGWSCTEERLQGLFSVKGHPKDLPWSELQRSEALKSQLQIDLLVLSVASERSPMYNNIRVFGLSFHLSRTL